MNDAISYGPLDGFVGYHLRRASSVVAADFTKVMATTGVRQVPFAILSVIAANPTIHQGGVASALGIKRANMVVLINELVQAGMVRRETSAADGRYFCLHLTEHGTAVFDEAVERIRVHEDRLLGGLTADERTSLIELLGRIEAQSG